MGSGEEFVLLIKYFETRQLAEKEEGTMAVCGTCHGERSWGCGHCDGTGVEPQTNSALREKLTQKDIVNGLLKLKSFEEFTEAIQRGFRSSAREINIPASWEMKSLIMR